jgi:hypothetical protein
MAERVVAPLRYWKSQSRIGQTGRSPAFEPTMWRISSKSMLFMAQCLDERPSRSCWSRTMGRSMSGVPMSSSVSSAVSRPRICDARGLPGGKCVLAVVEDRRDFFGNPGNVVDSRQHCVGIGPIRRQIVAHHLQGRSVPVRRNSGSGSPCRLAGRRTSRRGTGGGVDRALS